MYDYPALQALAEIIRRGSFEAAAHALHVTASAVSQRIRNLEERSGAVMIERGPPLRGTALGLRLAAHYDQVCLLEAALSDQSLGEDTAPVVRIAVNADSLASWAMPPLRHVPGLLELVIDDQDHAVDLLRNGMVSAALTSDPRPAPGCDRFAIGVMRYRATASPDFMRRHFQDGATEAALRSAPSVSFNTKDGLQEAWVRQLTGQRIALPLHRIASSQAFAEAVRLGMGWGMNPELLVSEDLRAGNLVDLAPDLPLDVPLYWQVSRQMAPALAKLTVAMRSAGRAVLRPIT